MIHRNPLLILLVAASVSGCYHATIDTGRPPSGETIENEWAHSFIGGLVPPSVVETAARCPNGVAQVETQLSFLNMVANALTFGLYSPMTITVQCAAAGTAMRIESGHPAAGREIRLAETASRDELAAALAHAARLSARIGEPVNVIRSSN